MSTPYDALDVLSMGETMALLVASRDYLANAQPAEARGLGRRGVAAVQRNHHAGV